MQENNIIRLNDFTGGLNEVAQAGRLKENQSPSLTNVIIDKLGTLKKRKGYTEVLDDLFTDVDNVTGLYLYHEEDGTEHFIATGGKEIFEVNRDKGTYEEIKSDLDDGEEFTFTTLGGICYMTNGENPLLEYDGTDITEINDAPTSPYIIDHDNHLFMADSNSLKYAEFADTSDWGTIDIPTDTGEQITGLFSLRGELVMFMSNSIHILYGDDPSNWQRKKVISGVGCIAPKSIVNIMEELYFMSDNGVYKFDGGNIQKISYQVSESIKKIKDTREVKSARYDDQYIMCYQDKDTDEYKALVHNPSHESWTKFEKFPVNCWNNFDGSQDGELDELYFGSVDEGQIYKAFDGYSDNGDKIFMTFSTKYLNAQQPELVNTFRKLMVDTQTQGIFNIDYSIDNGDKTGSIKFEGGTTKKEYLWGEVTWEELIWHEPENKRFVKSLRNAYGSSMQMTIRENSINPVEVYGITLVTRPKRQRWL